MAGPRDVTSPDPEGSTMPCGVDSHVEQVHHQLKRYVSTLFQILEIDQRLLLARGMPNCLRGALHIPRRCSTLDQANRGRNGVLYLAISPIAVNSILVWEDQGVRKIVYYTNRLLKDMETCYSRMEKVIYALLTSSCWF